jgi:hypothetical protein
MSSPEETTRDRTDEDSSGRDRAERRTDGEPALSEFDEAELTALVEELRAENRRLREEYARAQQTEYRRSAAALLALGVLAVLGGLVLPIGTELLFILGAIGLFGGAMTWFLTPERLVTATVGRSVYESVADTGSRLRAELGLRETSVYVPVDGAVEGVPVRLFVPQSSSYELPASEELTSLFVLPESRTRRGIAMRPTAAGLVREFETAVGGIAEDPVDLGAQLADALVEQFELVDGVEPEIDADGGRITLVVTGSAYDDVSAFDHPISSFLGTGLALGLDRPVTVETAEDESRTLVTCRW